MDSSRFDDLARWLAAVRSRRALTRLLGGGALVAPLAALSRGEAAAKNKKSCPPCKKRKKGKCKGTKPDGTPCLSENGGICQSGRCVPPVLTSPLPPPPPPPPPPLPATCFNGIKDGTETAVDCGGSCPRCATGQTCLVANDCVSGTCTGGVCVLCTNLQLCGSDANGLCQCHVDSGSGQPVCDNNAMLGSSVMDCMQCPAGTETCVQLAATVFNCFKRCGSP
jgi:hypothetical protein